MIINTIKIKLHEIKEVNPVTSHLILNDAQ